jgi:ParB family chromosome partitioning protein
MQSGSLTANAAQQIARLPEPERAAIVEQIKQGEKPHVAHNSGENEWYTPIEFIEAARRVMGRIDVDPASSEVANKTVGAGVYYDKAVNGLDKVWAGNIWMNPPYSGDLIGKFCEKLKAEYLEGRIKNAIVLVNNATETNWFFTLTTMAGAVVFTKGRVKFLDPQGNPGAPLQGQAIVYIGENVEGFLSEFSRFGWGAKL